MFSIYDPQETEVQYEKPKIYPDFANVAKLHQIHQKQIPREPENVLILKKKRDPNEFNLFSVMSLNLMRDEAHEKSEATKWSNRQGRFIKLIEDAKPTLLGLQECRDLLKSNEPFFKVKRALKKLEYQISVHENKEFPELRICNLWKFDSPLTHLESFTFWLNPHDYKASISAEEWNQKKPRPLGCDLFKIGNTNQMLLLYNTHLGHSELEKNESIKVIKTIMIDQLIQIKKKYNLKSYSYISTVFLGDCNFFYDMQGQEQRKHLCSVLSINPTNVSEEKTFLESMQQNTQSNEVKLTFQLKDWTRCASLILGDNKKGQEHGTFIGSSIDSKKPKLGECGNALDIIAGDNIQLLKAYIWNKTMLDPEPQYLANYDMGISDHEALLVKLSIRRI